MLHRSVWRLLLLLVIVAGCSGERVATVGGEDAYLEDWRDRWIVVNYWAEWCAPCREEIPELNELHAHSGSDGPIVVGVNYDGFEGEALDQIIERMDVQFPTVLDSPELIFGFERPAVLPTTVIIAPSFKVHATLKGPQSQQSILDAMVIADEAATDTGTL